MLCKACQDIFSSPRKLSYGKYYPWKQNAASFQVALRKGCRLCNLIDENRSYDAQPNEAFPKSIRYAFKALNPDWARSGKGSKWLSPQAPCDDEDDQRAMIHYMSQLEIDPTPNRLASLLTTNSEKLVSEAANSWLVLEFYGKHIQIVLPMELANRKNPLHYFPPRLTGTEDEIEELAQRNIDEQTSTGSEENLELSRAWLRNCQTNHSSCGARQPESWLPTRLLDVGSSDSLTIRLVLGSSLDIETQYIALSHRWGAHRGCVLNSGNITAYQDIIPFFDISATIRDAVAVTRALGFQYLWVDSMCIIQDDASDWDRESTTMSKVYGLSTCTIAAANSGCGTSGFFTTRNQYRIRPCRVPNPFSTETKYAFNIRSQYLYRIHDREVRDSLWYNRGWVFQERTLSPRLLIFSGTQILWACEGLQAAETWPCGKTSENYIDQFESFMVEKSRFYDLLDCSCGVSMGHSTWWTFLKDYMASAEFTYQSDRLRAIQGIANLIQGLTGMSYSGGFWLNDNLPWSLLWKAAPGNLPRSKACYAPSWSWAAVEGTAEHNINDFQTTANLVRIIGHENLQDDPTRSDRKMREALRIVGMLFHAAIIISREGDRCAKVVTIEYSKTIAARQDAVFRIIWSQWIFPIWSQWIVPISLFLWVCGLMYVCAVVAFMLLIALIPAVIALAIASMAIAIGLSPVLVVLYFLRKPLWSIGQFFRSYWIGLYPFCCFCIVRRAERKVEMQNMEAKRRREEAVSRTERFFVDLERGVPLADLQKVKIEGPKTKKIEAEDGITVEASCSLDTHLPAGSMIDVVFVPFVRRGSVTSGLLLRLIDRTVDRYERLGVFEASHRQLQKLHHPSKHEIILLV